ncbi:MAG: amidohydrolase family protein, partial [Gammaproteobacteria bacterium]|nr:amidohydrolase family protein [Gemmatimonadota bacterium]NIU73696.1 amidohydrolase family protein [Gammaproteobacteria bacterium]
AAVELTIEGAQFVPIELSENDIATIVRQPFVAGSSDGWVTEHGHGAGSPPRSYGAFVRRLERYVKQRELHTLPEAVQRITALPAEILGLRDRGRIDAGYAADLVIFDLEGLHDRA